MSNNKNNDLILKLNEEFIYKNGKVIVFKGKESQLYYNATTRDLYKGDANYLCRLGATRDKNIFSRGKFIYTVYKSKEVFNLCEDEVINNIVDKKAYTDYVGVNNNNANSTVEEGESQDGSNVVKEGESQDDIKVTFRLNNIPHSCKPTEEDNFNGWELTKVTMSIDEIITCIEQGMTINPRYEINEQSYYDLLIFDIDNEDDYNIKSLESLVRDFKDHLECEPIFAYPTFSDSGTMRRYRVIYRFEKPIVKKKYVAIYSLFVYTFKFLDEKCRHAERLFFGTNKTGIKYQDSYIRENIIEALESRYKEQEQAIHEHFTRKLFKVPNVDLDYPEITQRYQLTEYAKQERHVYLYLRSNICCYDLMQDLYGQLDHKKYRHPDMYRCPVHGGDHGDNLKYYPKTDSFTCFSECNQYFDTVTLLQMKYNTCNMTVVYYKAVEDGYLEGINSLYMTEITIPINNTKLRQKGKGEEAIGINKESITDNNTNGIVWYIVNDKNKPKNFYKNFEILMNFFGIKCYFNVYTKRVECYDPKGILGLGVNITDDDLVMISVREICKECDLNLSMDDVKNYLLKLGMANKVNKFLDFLEANRNEEYHHLIKKVFDILPLKNEEKYDHCFTLFKTFLASVCHMANNTLENKYSSQGILCLLGMLRGKKSTFFRELLPNPEFFIGDYTLDPDNKDKIIESTSAPVVELSEIDGITRKKDVASMKAYITRTSDTYRVPYGRVSKTYERMTTYCASLNDRNFLKDKTGDRKYWVIELRDERIDIDKLKNIDLNKFWGAVYDLYLKGEIKPYLPYEVEDEVIRENKEEYRVNTSVGEVLDMIFDFECTDMSQYKNQHMKDILEKAKGIDNKIDAVKIREELERRGFEYNKSIKAHGKNSTGFKRLPPFTGTVTERPSNNSTNEDIF